MALTHGLLERGCCPLCGWRGLQWMGAETKPGRVERILCPVCASTPRERLLYLAIVARQRRAGRRLRVLEVGGTPRLSAAARAIANYTNADVEEREAGVDVLIRAGHLVGVTDVPVDVIVLSFVLSMIPVRAERLKLLRSLYEISEENGLILFMDDCDFMTSHSTTLEPGAFFHDVRFGTDVLRDMELTGWRLRLHHRLPWASRLQVARDLPLVVGTVYGMSHDV